MTVASPRRRPASKLARRRARDQTLDVARLSDELRTGCVVAESPPSRRRPPHRGPLLVSPGQRGAVLADLRARGYALLLRRGAPHALVTADETGALTDRLTGRRVAFAPVVDDGDRACRSDDEADRRRSHRTDVLRGGTPPPPLGSASLESAEGRLLRDVSVHAPALVPSSSALLGASLTHLPRQSCVDV